MFFTIELTICTYFLLKHILLIFKMRFQHINCFHGKIKNVDKISFEIYSINSFLILTIVFNFKFYTLHSHIHREGGGGGVRYPICKGRTFSNRYEADL